MLSLERPRLIILITIDCLRADMLGCYGAVRKVTPNIDRMAGDSIVFSDIYTNCSSTRGSFGGILFSRMPWEVYDIETRRVKDDIHSLQRTLVDAGFKTAGIHTNPWISRFFGFEKHFSFFSDDLRFYSPFPSFPRLSREYRRVKHRWRLLTYKGSSATASEINRLAMRWITRNQKDRIFLHVHYMDCHEPYFPKSKYFRQVTGRRLTRGLRKRILQLHKRTHEGLKVLKVDLNEEDIQLIVNSYLSCLKYVDQRIGELMNYLKQERLLENSLVLLTADHGQQFGERGYFMHGGAYDEVLHVPLIISAPAFLSPSVISSQRSLIDIAPTILDMLGLDSPITFRGESLVPLMRGVKNIEDKVHITQNASKLDRGMELYWSIRTPTHKLILTFNQQMERIRTELYDLKNDTHELVNLVSNAVPLPSFAKPLLVTLMDYIPEECNEAYLAN